MHECNTQHKSPRVTSEEAADEPPCGRYLLVSKVADVQRVSVLIHLFGPAARWRAILTVRLARVGTEAGVL